MKKILGITLLAVFSLGTLSSCGARKNNCDCPKNVNDKYKAPKAHKRNIFSR